MIHCFIELLAKLKTPGDELELLREVVRPWSIKSKIMGK